MRIAHISKADPFGGGASKVASGLTGLLNDRGVASHHWVSWAGGGFTETMRPLYGRHYNLIKSLHWGQKRMGLPELIPFELPFLLWKKRAWDYDILHFHDLSSAISPLTLSLLSRVRKVVWTIHDCSPFTGGCLYPMGCEAWKSRCGDCPQIGEWPIDCWFDFTGAMQYVKERLHKSGRVVPVAPSEWMADMALSSGKLPRRPTVINNGVDTDMYRPHDRADLRSRLGIDASVMLIMLSAGDVLDERKGVRYALQAVEGMKKRRCKLLVVGMCNEESRAMLQKFDYIETGYVSDQNVMNEYYAASDLFLFCSLADNQPLSVLESMSSGTPVVGFRTGGIPEMVTQNETGFLVDQYDVDGLAGKLNDLMDRPEVLLDWGRCARGVVEQRYAYDVHVDNYISLYESLLAGDSGVMSNP